MKWKLFLLFLMFNTFSCTTTQIAPPPPPHPPSFVSVPHPVGMDLGDLVAVLKDPAAPKEQDFAVTCDQNFQKLKASSTSQDELDRGMNELVRGNPVYYHWCFYSKLFLVENQMKSDSYVDEKQRVVLDQFDFLTPVARAFAKEYHDSRYLRWAVTKYKTLSEWVFYRRLDLTPAGTAELVQASNPFGLWRDAGEKTPVLEKYHIVVPGAPVVTTLEDLADTPPAQPKAAAKPSELGSFPASAVRK